MARYKALSEDLCSVLVHMHYKRGLSVKEIEQQTNVKERMIQKIFKLYRETGQLTRQKANALRPHKINADQEDVSHFLNLC
jgi:transposase